MILWTIQDAPWLERLQSRGRITGDWRRVWPEFKPAYKWMVGQMADRGIGDGRRAPVWAWRRDDSGGRPDLRAHRWRYPIGERLARIEFESPDDLVLLSLDETWHCVLNECACTDSESEFEQVWARRDAGLLPRSEIESSWQRIFDLERGDPAWCGEPAERRIQACLPLVDAAWVRRIDWFVGWQPRRR